MMDEDLDILAAEYALGTATAEERAEVKQLLTKDVDFAARVALWERRLGVLEAMVEAVEPPSIVGEHVRARIAGVAPDVALRLPELATVAPGPDPMAVAALARRVRLWRAIAIIAVGIVIALLIAGAVARLRPELFRVLLPPQTQKESGAPRRAFEVGWEGKSSKLVWLGRPFRGTRLMSPGPFSGPRGCRYC